MFNVQKLKLFGSAILITRYQSISCNSTKSFETTSFLLGSAKKSKSSGSSSGTSKFYIQARLITCSSSTSFENLHKTCTSFSKSSIRKLPFQLSKSENKLIVGRHNQIIYFSSTSTSYNSNSDDDDSSSGITMNYFIIGVSGVTCGGKTTLTKLLQKSFPWSRVIHQDAYFYPDEYEGHVRIPEIENHVNYDTETALDMKRMHRDILDILDYPPVYKSANGVAPNFEGLELIRNLEDLDIDTSKYSSIPVLIIEGFTIFGSDILYDNSDVRFFLTLDEETCRIRRSLRNFDPPDCRGYFENCIWPEYQKHYKKHIENRIGIFEFSGKTNVRKLWRESIEAITQKMEDKFPFKLDMSNNS